MNDIIQTIMEWLAAFLAGLVALLSAGTAQPTLSPTSSPGAQVTVDSRPSTVTASDIRDCYGEGPYPWWIDEPRPNGVYTCDYGDE